MNKLIDLNNKEALEVAGGLSRGAKIAFAAGIAIAFIYDPVFAIGAVIQGAIIGAIYDIYLYYSYCYDAVASAVFC